MEKSANGGLLFGSSWTFTVLAHWVAGVTGFELTHSRSNPVSDAHIAKSAEFWIFGKGSPCKAADEIEGLRALLRECKPFLSDAGGAPIAPEDLRSALSRGGRKQSLRGRGRPVAPSKVDDRSPRQIILQKPVHTRVWNALRFDGCTSDGNHLEKRFVIGQLDPHAYLHNQVFPEN